VNNSHTVTGKSTRGRAKAILDEIPFFCALQVWLDGVDAVNGRIGGFETVDKLNAETA
jgi:hypothetical protein